MRYTRYVSRYCSSDNITRMRWNTDIDTCFNFHTDTDSWYELHTDTYLCNTDFGAWEIQTDPPL